MPSLSVLGIIVLGALAFVLGRHRSIVLAQGPLKALPARPVYYGWYVAIFAASPAAVLLVLWTAISPPFIRGMVIRELPSETLVEQPAELMFTEIVNVSGGAFAARTQTIAEAAARYSNLSESSTRICWLLLALLGTASLLLGLRKVSTKLHARVAVEQFFRGLLLCSSLVAVLTTAGILVSLLFETSRFFSQVSPFSFLLGTQWSPQMAIRSDQVASEGAFGAIPLFLGTAVISSVAMLVAAPIGLLSAVYLSEYADARTRAVAKPALEILAGIPTVVYGFFAAFAIAPLIRDAASSVGIPASSESALAAGLVMGVMIVPFVSSLSDDILHAIPQSLRDGSYALGATQSETIVKVLLPAALPGIVAALLLAVSRAIGETMIVVMAAGLSANMTVNPLESVTTVTVQIVNILVGDQEFDSPKTLASFALGLSLFVVTFILNIIALIVVKKYRERYD